MQREVQAQKLDKAIQTLQGGFVLAPWQFLVAAQLHSNIGILLYLKQDDGRRAPPPREELLAQLDRARHARRRAVPASATSTARARSSRRR